MAKVKVIATAKGHDGTQLRNVGDIFHMERGVKGSWFTEYKPRRRNDEPEAVKGSGGEAGDDNELV